ncbi:GNAT superfamily N-acetyltransferase [Thermocatellispora tengchongensis]|uniref:GNAT superfamily N-acetyltransferase n=1 Tax=Thermocatellispora tengchongensis TaxID=1073253 RepID=A0A840P665_9ACTN|nr:GNAT family N-acetyltransferase [Thermocatellispora tengchongensis]MBB5131495.1 GNAT superfamily N-acetyltransferase [Thermocatellispora tengchongensis]
MTHAIGLMSAPEFGAAVPGLAEVLADVVAGGDSLGFLSPFGPEEAAAWWRGLTPAVESGALLVWAARDGERVTGTISLARSWKANARHRAEVVKLMVRRDARRRGLARALLAAAEREAVRSGASLLVLDTETGSDAERLYLATGWTRYGVVPGYATDTAGVPRDCSFFYKRVPGPAS